MMNIVGTLILTPASSIAACDLGATQVFQCAADQLLRLPIAAVIPALPLHEHVVSDNIRYVNQFGDLTRWQRYIACSPHGHTAPIELMFSRCGFRPAAALCLFLRLPWAELEHTAHRHGLSARAPLWPGLRATPPQPAARCRVLVHP